MAVFTAVPEGEMLLFLRLWNLPPVLEISPIAQGTDNSNFLIRTKEGKAVFTLAEEAKPEEFAYALALMRHLSCRGIPVAAPIPSAKGELWHLLERKPAALVSFVDGGPIIPPRPEHCAQAGEWLARAHLAGQDFLWRQGNRRGLPWQRQVLSSLGARLPEEVFFQAEQALGRQESLILTLPEGTLHADLFCDNVFFLEGRIEGVIDFYYAFFGPQLFDLAVAACDWAVTEEGGFDEKRLLALLFGYESVRPLLLEEKRAFPLMLERAALRFFISRLYDAICRQAQVGAPKDPWHFHRVLEDIKRRFSQSELSLFP